MKFGISGDTYGYYKNGQLVGFKSQADIDAAYQSGYTAGVAAGETTHTGTYTITNPPKTNQTIDLGVHHSYRYISIVYTVTPWATGNINTIKSMCNDPNINVADWWAIGQTREESSSTVYGSSSQSWVITDMNSTTSGGTAYNAIIHTLYLYPTVIYMNSNNTNVGGWSSSLMRTSTMRNIYNSLNSNFKPLIKTISNISGAGGGSDTTQTTSDQIWLFSEHEVQDTKYVSGSQEFSACKLFSYFGTSSNRIKTGNTTAVGKWWLRTPSVLWSDTRYFCQMINGASNVEYASSQLGVCAAAAI